ncbi:MAG: hypothetical protein ABIG67_01810 [Pseudomonadota bacterium]
MSMTLQEAEFEQGMDELYKEFRRQYEDEYVFEQIHNYYKDNPDIPKATLNYYHEAQSHFSQEYYTTAFLLTTISIEVGIKVIILKPILFSLAFDKTAGELLYDSTFKRKSVPEIPNLYYQILQDIAGFDFKNYVRVGETKTLWEELKKIQKLRNEVIHQAKNVSPKDALQTISIARSIHEEVIPNILDSLHFHIEDERISSGTRKDAELLKKFEKDKRKKIGS